MTGRETSRFDGEEATKRLGKTPWLSDLAVNRSPPVQSDLDELSIDTSQSHPFRGPATTIPSLSVNLGAGKARNLRPDSQFQVIRLGATQPLGLNNVAH